MAEIIQDTPVLDSPAPVADTPTPEADEPLSAHIEQFHTDPGAQADPEPVQQPEKKRHRSFKNQARAEDVPRIKALTAERDEWKTKYEEATKPKPAAVEPVAPPPAPKPAAPVQFSDKEPVLEDYLQTQGDPYANWLKDWNRWDRKREGAEQAQQSAKAAQEAEAAKTIEAVKQRAQTYADRLKAYQTEHPDRVDTFKGIPNVDAPLLVETIWSLPDGPDVVYSLRQSPALWHELILLTAGKPVSPEYVAATTQWLRTRLQAGTTGAAVRGQSPTPAVPRPPTPVRTPPMTPPPGPPGDEGSLMDHQRFFKSAR